MSQRLSREELDALRLLALSRIPRCGGCARFRALDAVRRGALEVPRALPPVPRSCTHVVCEPLAARFPAELGTGRGQSGNRRKRGEVAAERGGAKSFPMAACGR